jgi:hypothetical protein
MADLASEANTMEPVRVYDGTHPRGIGIAVEHDVGIFCGRG